VNPPTSQLTARMVFRFFPFKCSTQIHSENLSRQDAKAQRKTLCHFDRREKSFLDPSHSLGMTGQGLSLGVLCAFARVISFRFGKPKSNRKPQLCLISFSYRRSTGFRPSLNRKQQTCFHLPLATADFHSHRRALPRRRADRRRPAVANEIRPPW
jgi:hypothetical protein